MKKIICLLLAAVVLLLSVGCNQQEPSSPTEQPTEEKQTEPKVYDNSPYESANIGWEGWGYTYIEYLLKNATDVVKATYVGTVKKPPNYYFHDFEVKEVFKGGCENGLLTVFASSQYYSFGGYEETPPVLSYETSNINYEIEKDYLLLLCRSQNVFMYEDRIESIDDSLVIPFDQNGNINAEGCKLYGIDLRLSIRDKETSDALENGNFVDRVLELTKYNPQILNKIDTTEKSLETIINEADYAMVIKPEEKIEDAFEPYWCSKYSCKIIDLLKGTDLEKTAGSDIRIKLPTERIELGKTYLVAIEKTSVGVYEPTTRYSVIPYEVQ